jgi:hypothetical protein
MTHLVTPKHPLAEVFGFPISNNSPEARRFRKNKLCPFNNKVPNCTKDKADEPLGVCSIFNGDGLAITCPIRFREAWLIAEDAARFLFPSDTFWTSLTEIRLEDRHGKSAGNIDIVLVAYDRKGQIIDFGSLEVQAVYISGNIRRPFEHYLAHPEALTMDWSTQSNYPRADYLSSSRKRLLPQLLYKGAILHAWGKKQVVALHKAFYEELPSLPEVPKEEGDMAWLLYDLVLDDQLARYRLIHHRTVHTKFEAALTEISTPSVGPIEEFVSKLQAKLDGKLENPPDTRTLLEDPLTP